MSGTSGEVRSDIGEFELPIPVPALKPMNHGLKVADAVDMRWTLKEKLTLSTK